MTLLYKMRIAHTPWNRSKSLYIVQACTKLLPAIHEHTYSMVIWFTFLRGSLFLMYSYVGCCYITADSATAALQNELAHTSLPFIKNQYFSEHDKNTFFFLLHSTFIEKQLWNYETGTFLEACNHRSVMEPLNNPPLCCSTDSAHFRRSCNHFTANSANAPTVRVTHVSYKKILSNREHAQGSGRHAP